MTDTAAHESSPFVHFEGTVWPASVNQLRHLEYVLRYGRRDYEFNMQERLLAASVINAYIELVWQTQKRRNEICQSIRCYQG
jgi:hypothetical protein